MSASPVRRSLQGVRCDGSGAEGQQPVMSRGGVGGVPRPVTSPSGRTRLPAVTSRGRAAPIGGPSAASRSRA